MRLKYKTQLRELIRSGAHIESTINVYPSGQWDILVQDCPSYAPTVMCIPVHEISRYTNIDDGITIIFDVINTALNHNHHPKNKENEIYNKDQYEMLIKGNFEAWDDYRRDNAKVVINLEGADLSNVDLSNVDLSCANLRGANLSDAGLCDADLSRANLRDADLSRARLRGTDLSCTNLRGANFDDAKF